MILWSGEKMHQLARRLFPICRSLTGEGTRQTLAILSEGLNNFQIRSVESGKKVFDWEVPNEWNISEAFIEDEAGKRIIDFKTNNLHVVGYSESVDKWMTLEELQPNLHSLPQNPNAIPYVTSYYRRTWGFCLSQIQRDQLKKGRYHVVIKSNLEPGILNFGELLIPGQSKEEILVSTYVCHPSMANNELSGPIVALALVHWVNSLPHRYYSYRFLFVPETIGSIAYLSENWQQLKNNTIAGFVLSCIGDERAYSFVSSRLGNTLSDRVARLVMKFLPEPVNEYSFLKRGSDERQYCSPGINLPVVGLCRSKYAEYPEYHTSLDDLSLVTPEGLEGGFFWARQCIELVEANRKYLATVLCEPQMGKRNLYPTLSIADSRRPFARKLIDVLTYCDGNHDLVSVCEKVELPPSEVIQYIEILLKNDLIKKVS